MMPDYYLNKNDEEVDNTKPCDTHCIKCIKKKFEGRRFEYCSGCHTTIPNTDINAGYRGSGNPKHIYLSLKCDNCGIVCCDECYDSKFEEDKLDDIDGVLCKKCNKE